MAGEPRRSHRATKGQHTKNQDEEPLPIKKRQTKAKSKASKTAESNKDGNDGEEDDAIVRCVCGADEDIQGWMMACCEKCEAWQHNLCMGIPEADAELPEEYYCERCRPEAHSELLAAMQRGEKPWEERIKQREEAEKSKKKGKKGGRGKRTSAANEKSATTGTPKPVPIQVDTKTAAKMAGPESGTKRKFDAVEPTNGQSQKTTSGPSSAISPTAVASSPGTISPSATMPGTQRKTSLSVEHPPKRAKSVSEQNRRESLASPATRYNSIEDLPELHQKVASALLADFVKLIPQAVKKGLYKLPENKDTESLASTLALEIEHELRSRHSSNNYTHQVRTIRYNIKKNEVLLSRILTGSLQPFELADMSSDDMASEELQKQVAAMKERADKQAVLSHEQGPRYRKTHKGEELIGEDPGAKPTEKYTAPVRRVTLEQLDASIDSGPVDQGSPQQVELPEEIEHHPDISVDSPGEHKSSNFNIQQVWKSVHSPGSPTGEKLIRQAPRRRSSAVAPDTRTGGESKDDAFGDVEDPDLDRLLRDDDGTVSPTAQQPQDPSIIWRGRLSINAVASLACTAKWAAGGKINKAIHYTDLLPRDLEIDGRIGITTADDYVSSMRYSTSDVTVLSLTPLPIDADRRAFNTIFNYLKDKGRWGVVSRAAHPCVKDLFVIPLDAGKTTPPRFVGLLEDVLIEDFRSENTLLLTLVAKTKNLLAAHLQGQSQSQSPTSAVQTAPAPLAPSTPVQSTFPSFSPVVGPGGSTFPSAPGQTAPTTAGASPGGPAAPPAGGYRIPDAQTTSLGSNLAKQILGHFINTPVVTQILGAVGDMTNVQLQNLRDILEREPATRDNIVTLSEHLKVLERDFKGP